MDMNLKLNTIKQRNKKNKILFLFFFLILFSCKENTYNKKVQGAWVCTYSSISTGKLALYKKHLKITFKDDSFNFLELNYDLERKFEGKYIITENKKQNRKSLILIPDLVMSNQHSIYIEYLCFDIIKISDSIMVLQMPTKFDNDFMYNELLYFKKKSLKK